MATGNEERVVRCFGGPDDPLMSRYHDEEWGVPLHDDRKLLEFLLLDGAQAGLSWRTILNKREAYRAAFDDFDAVKIAAYTDADRARLLDDAGIVRNRQKVDAFITNAQRFLEVQAEFGSFDAYIWSFTGHQTLRRDGELTWENTPARSPESDAMAADLKRRGFKFAGSVICYAFMQSAGMVNDHITGCIREPREA
ncbi:MAG: DNA-3-methyladenine glycosylase I [Chloroflexota bacterium]|nr:DNA-3-methyladenine glycosylase I [Chloroflexota bacterium]